MKIAVISDIHAHKYRVKAPQSSLILSDRNDAKPALQNPLKALEVLIDKNKLQADLLLLPGDFCDLADENGFQFAWENMLKIADNLGTTDVISSIGNHDVQRNAPNPFNIVEKIAGRNIFPSLKSPKMNELFWNRGYSYIEDDNLDYFILVINSSYHHYKKDELDKGKIEIDVIEEVKELLNTLDLNKKKKICLLHHPPFPHERYGNKSQDYMYNGSELLSLIDLFDFHLVIHGHKHDAMIRQSLNGSGSATILSSGSFSVLPEQMSNVAPANFFHIIELKDDELQNCYKRGIIKSWNFISSRGWSNKNTYHLPFISGFGCTTPPPRLASITHEYLMKETKNGNKYYPITWKELLAAIPEIAYLTPYAFKMFGIECSKLNVRFNYELPYKPEFIHLQK